MTKVVLYQDGSVDDYIALCYLAALSRQSKIKLVGVMTAGTGEVDAKCGLQNVAAVCNALNLQGIALGQGEDKRINPDYGQSFPDYIRSFIDTLPSLVGLNGKTINEQVPDVVESLHQIISQSEDPILIIATGPLTDLDRLFKTYPEDKKKVKISLMGGAIHIAGNIKDLDPKIPNDVAEWNIFADIAAARNVIASGVPLLMVPLDVTKYIRVTQEFYNQLAEMAGKDSEGAVGLMYELITALKNAFEKEHPEISFFEVYYLWDPFAAMVALDSQFAKIEEKYIQVNLATGKTEEVAELSEGVGRIRVAMDIAKPATEILKHLLDVVASLAPPEIQAKKSNVPSFTLFGKTGSSEDSLEKGHIPSLQ
ncbi:nucleoside hydrolase [Legionella hackeliae]|uniref:Inosine/uridine-preferring nucleoside hydrolase domain-containing protein n=1 Tax=Legionella hackeliae TaxID=449 RepID=A0A0A8UV31_LEGHA|nr:nucleoside hydrolase [Legionella hackeliae]KTD15252.1 inosine-uridine preferring nucleoside hydrolase [Legionella hackeliae]CEK11381.1 protein of unknown function [Legionella hackeliae]STX48153.1 inosine-uridine preferring nucleoside hydrolase [Legionella hackeliae]